jgi:hypothetical protein
MTKRELELELKFERALLMRELDLREDWDENTELRLWRIAANRRCAEIDQLLTNQEDGNQLDSWGFGYIRQEE